MKSALEALSFSPLYEKLLKKRGLENPAQVESFLQAGLDRLEDPFQMKGMKDAVERLRVAVQNKEKILIHGDYDVDGVTASAILARLLKKKDANFSVFLPERQKDGYGLRKKAIEQALADEVKLLITADCGITAFDEIQFARDSGLDVIVVDHHQIPPKGIPPATIILNPQQEDCPYAFRELSAAGLAFKLAQAWIQEEAFEFLDLAALSTVCDVAPLNGENRVIVKNGLLKMADSSTAGMSALIEVSKIRTRIFNVGHLGFMLGPRINACGRMSTPDIALRLLLTDSKREAASLAMALDEENKLRQAEERQTTKQAIAEVERSVNFNRDKVILVGREGWHQGVVGIVASRLVEKYKRPAVVIAFKDGVGKGSGRSIKGFNLHGAMKNHTELMEEFGGHEQAIGLSITNEKFDQLKKDVNERVSKETDAETFVSKVKYDLEISFEDITSIFLQELKLLEPHGVGNSRPTFKSQGLTLKRKPIRLSPQTLQFWLTDGSLTFEARLSSRYGVDAAWASSEEPLEVCYSLKSKVWDGRETIHLEVKDIQFPR